MRHLRWLSIAVCLALLAQAVPVPSSAAQALMPDLGMAKLKEFSIQNVSGQKRLRFTTIIINIGKGPFQVHGHDKQSNGEFLVDQQIRNGSGSWSTRSTSARMYFAGDGHNHWHVRDLEKYVLKRSGTQVGTGEKHGFCFYDNKEFDQSLPGSPSQPGYPIGSCGNLGDSSVTTGLSVGWGDRYSHKIVDQYIIINGLPDGTYTLTATADSGGWFAESCEGNNSTTATLRISGNSVTVLSKGSNSKPC